MHKGFTLLEILLVTALIAIVFSFSFPVYRNLIKKNDLDIAYSTISSSLRRSQVLSQAVDGDVTWGVKVQNGSVVIFKGNSYTTRDQTFDETFEISPEIGIGGNTEIVFSKLTGIPQTIGSTSLTTENDVRTININEKGTIY